MPKISSLVLNQEYDAELPQGTNDPFVNSEALSEATLLDILYTSLSPTAAILLDLRTSQFVTLEKTVNTGIFIFRGVTSITIVPRDTGSPHVWLIDDVLVLRDNQQITFHLAGLISNDTVTVKAEMVEFLMGFVEDIGEVAIAIDDDTASYFQTIPNWGSTIHLLGRISIGHPGTAGSKT